MCPVGFLLDIYSRLSFFGWRVKDKNVCADCKDKSCVHKKYYYNLNEKSCGVDLYPGKIEDNSHCILCAGCLKTCKNYNTDNKSMRPNPEYRLIGFGSDLFQIRSMKIPEMVFLMIVSGFVISEIWSEWSVTNDYLNYFPNIFFNYLGIENKALSGIFKGLIIFVFYPIVLWLLLWIITNFSKVKLSFKEFALNYGIAFIPIAAAAHSDKAILKTTSRLPYFYIVFTDITGITTANRLVNKQVSDALLPQFLNNIISVLLILIVCFGIFFSSRVIYLLNKKYDVNAKVKIAYLLPIIYGSIFLFMLILWRLY